MSWLKLILLIMFSISIVFGISILLLVEILTEGMLSLLIFYGLMNIVCRIFGI